MSLIRFQNLGSLAVGHNNNFNLLRLLAALGVFVSHTVLITQGREAVPQIMWTLGTTCVWVFFVISGFLIAGSFERSSSIVAFMTARCLRIFPALFVCVIVTAFALGASQTHLPLAEYYADPQTYRFVFGNMSLFMETRELPGVFTNHPVSYAQVTFWTLKYEFICYLLLMIFGIMGLFRNQGNFLFFLGTALVLWMAVLIIEVASPAFFPFVVLTFYKLALMFVLGMTAYMFRDRIWLSGALAAALVAATAFLWFTPLFHVLMPLTVAYSVLWAAYVPKGMVLHFNRVGDYSYGVYIIAVPIQQLMVAVVPDHSPLENFAYSLLPTMGLAMMSWHFIEEPCLRQKVRFQNWRKSGATTMTGVNRE